jgi:hypothetical protein
VDLEPDVETPAKKPNPVEPQIRQLPYDIHYEILSWLSLEELWKVRAVCRIYQEACLKQIQLRYITAPPIGIVLCEALDPHISSTKKQQMSEFYGPELMQNYFSFKRKRRTEQKSGIEPIRVSVECNSRALIFRWPLADVFIRKVFTENQPIHFYLTIGRTILPVVEFNVKRAWCSVNGRPWQQCTDTWQDAEYITFLQTNELGFDRMDAIGMEFEGRRSLRMGKPSIWDVVILVPIYSLIAPLRKRIRYTEKFGVKYESREI